MTERLINPVHFFNSCGVSAYTEAYLLERIATLEAENARLERLLRRKETRECGEAAN